MSPLLSTWPEESALISHIPARLCPEPRKPFTISRDLIVACQIQTKFPGGLHAICDRTKAIAMARTVSVLFVLVCVFGAAANAVVVGGPRPIGDFTNNLEVDELAKFAVDQYKSHLNSISDISFSKVLAAKEQVVQGTMYYLTVEVMEGGVPKEYEAKVWVKPWEAFKELESFLPSAPAHYDSAAGLTTKSEDLKKEKIGG